MKLAGSQSKSFVREQENYNIFYETNEDIKILDEGRAVDRMFCRAGYVLHDSLCWCIFRRGDDGRGGLQVGRLILVHHLSGPLLGSAQQLASFYNHCLRNGFSGAYL
jgi:hypothetical protein